MLPVVFVVHDDRDTRAQIIAALHAAGYDVVSFDDPMAALSEIEEVPDLPIVVTRIDFGQGRLNGVALARMLKSKRRGIKVIFVGLPKNLEHVRDLGVGLPVPLDADALVQAVAKLSQSEEPDPARW